jgi:DNA adenine methylase
MGSKSKIAKYIVPILQETIDKYGITTYVEPFCGGCNIIDKIKCENRYAFDKSETLIALLKLVQSEPEKLLKEPTRELWDICKEYKKNGIPLPKEISLADCGAIEFLSSFCSRGFPGGYANDGGKHFKAARQNLLKQAAAPTFKNIIFNNLEYKKLPEYNNILYYLDPPYAGTKTYDYTKNSKFNYEEFWNWVRDISKNNYVFVSEQIAPKDFEVVWEKEVRRTVASSNDFMATEKLFKYKT